MRVVTQIPPRLARRRIHLSGRLQHRIAWRVLQVGVVLAVCCFASFACAQASTEASPPPQPSRRPVQLLPSATVSDETLPQPPVVSWDGKRLTIDAENSKLEDILLAVRNKTGASIDFPASAAQERVAMHFGPAPAREVLSSLLYGSDFDYVIQAADDDPDGLRSVVLTARGKGDESTAADDSVVATGPVKTPGMRMMRGYAAPSKPAFQAAAEATIAAEQTSADGTAPAADGTAPPAAESPAATDAVASTAGQSSPASGAESASAGSQSANATSSSADGSTVTSDIPPNTTPPATSAGNSGEQSEVSQKMQDMVRMFQQRQQIQAQQNQSARTPAN